MKICPVCGTENEDSAQNCQLCNYALDMQQKMQLEPEPLPVQPPLPKKKPPYAIIAVLIILVVVGAVIGFLYFERQSAPQKQANSPPGTDGNSETTAVKQTEPETAAAQQPPEVISSAFVDTGEAEYVPIYQSADTGSSAVARAYTGDAVDIYAIEGSWYHVQLGEVSGYLEAVYVTFSEPQPATEPTTVQTTARMTENTTAAQTKPVQKQKPTISASIVVETSSVGDGATFYLKTSGSYAYYTYEASAYLANGESEYLGSFTSSDPKVRLTAGSVFSYVTATVTPYHADGTAGETVTCRGNYGSDYAPAQQSASVSACTKYGQLNTHGSVVAGFTTSYVVNGGSPSHIRDSLGNTWHVTAVNYCYSRGVNWYELYDSDDGDYYGWVDANYIDFY